MLTVKVSRVPLYSSQQRSNDIPKEGNDILFRMLFTGYFEINPDLESKVSKEKVVSEVISMILSLT